MDAKKTSDKQPKKIKFIEPTDSTLTLFAICSTENGYRLSWLLNNSSLSLSLQRLELNNDNFPEFICRLDIFSEEESNGAVLLPNAIEPSKFIAPKYKKFDYLLAVRHPLSEQEIASFETAIKRIPGVITGTIISSIDKKTLELVNLF